ncbi:MAG: hypothetical protein H6605_07355 [Flavobacteriales bacterium]|nr:hypothetical protein [Flavobacteriales bacterium]
MENTGHKLLNSFFFLLISGLSFGQKMKPTEWSCVLKGETLNIGDTLILEFRGNIPEHQSVYATNFECDLGPFPTKIAFLDSSRSYNAIGNAYSKGEIAEYDSIFGCEVRKFKKTAVIGQKMVLRSSEPTLKGRIEYQTCTDEMCLQFYVEFEMVGNKLIRIQNVN